MQRLHDTVPPVVARLKATGALPADQDMELALTLPMQHQEAFEQLFKDVTDPFSPRYRHYLTHNQFAQQFGASEADYEELAAFAERSGLTVTARHLDRTLLNVHGSVAAIQKAFRVRLRTYRHPIEDREFFSADTDPAIECQAAGVRVIGLDDFARPHRSQAAARPVDPKAAATGGSGPAGTYWGCNFRAAYAPGVSLTGAGQKVALVEFDGYYPGDVANYAKKAGLRGVPVKDVCVNTATVAPGANNAEVAGDIEMINSMAPGLSAIVVYQSSSTTQPAILNLFAKIKEDNSARQISMSWTLPDAGYGSYATYDSIFKTYAVQGQSFFACAGDQDADRLSAYYNDDPYITIVGGTCLNTDSNENWISEVVWNDRTAMAGGPAYNGTAGGVSSNYSIPSWQLGTSMAANGGSAKFRNYPDVSIIACNIYEYVADGQQWIGEGTSFGAPLWAAFNALVNEQAASNGLPAVGFLNPLLYAIGNSALGQSAFHDVTSGDNNFDGWTGKYYSAAPGYDLVSGWGTPNGSNLISYLAGPSQDYPAAAILHNFLNGDDGSGPSASLSLSGNTLFAAAATGGKSGCGTICSVTTSGSNFTILHSFTNGLDGGLPYSPLTISGGAIYGAASVGGASSHGTIFSMSTSGSGFKVLHSFGGADGNGTESPLLLVGSTLYGVCATGGADNAGVIFSISTSGAKFKVLHTFTSGADGAFPCGELALSGTTLYGTACGGGAHGDGTVFSISTSGANFKTLHAFTGESDGAGASGGVTLAGGMLYGTAAEGGSAQDGTIFSLNTSGSVFKVLYAFTNGIDGATPHSALTLAGGTLYGTASAGGTWGDGTVFSLPTSGVSFTSIHSFSGGDGWMPYSAPVFSGAVLYGTTVEGGTDNEGAVYSLPLMSLVNWWAAEGTAKDSVPFARDIGANEAAPTCTGVTYAPGHSGEGFQFNGASCVNFGPSAGNFGTNNFAVDFWIATSASGAQTILGKRPTSGFASLWGFRMGADGTVNFSICANASGKDNRVLTSASAINDGSFHEVTAVRLGLDVFLYIDGKLSAEGATGSIADISNTTALTAGWEPCVSGEAQFDGVLDEIKLYEY